METCSICVEQINKSTRRKINCPGCQNVICSSCVETYLLNTTQNAHCMQCRIGWTREILDTVGLTKKFITHEYKTRCKNILFERERSLMPGTQVEVERERRIRKCNADIAAMIQQTNSLTIEYSKRVRTVTNDHIAEMYNIEDEIECTMKWFDYIHEPLNDRAVLMQMISGEEAKIRRLKNGTDGNRTIRKFIRACPHANCAGFLSSMWKCGVCDNWSCPECHEVKGLEKDTPHECKPDNVATARLLEKDSRPCPSCASMIFKIEGCDQMWCTQCSTAFSWRTGAIELGRIHNPHYYEYQRNTGAPPREPGDIPCGGMPSIYDIRAHINHPYVTLLLDKVRIHHHIGATVLPRYNQPQEDNTDLRVKYMIKDIDENKFKSLIEARNKKNEFNLEVTNVLNTYQLVTAEITQRALFHGEHLEEEYGAIKRYVNDLLMKIHTRYHRNVPFV
jgi:hypothetical protein